jgi:two-component system chemotaxis response regulator CheY
MSTALKIKSALKSTKVLIIEDDSIMLGLIREILKIMGFSDITVVKDGNHAFNEIKLNNYDLIFCDWIMPGMNGIEFSKALRRLPQYEKCGIPIIMVTGKATVEDVKTARDAGVNEYLAKPFSIHLLTSKIKSVIENPRPFVVSDNYIGPDRRHKNSPESIPGGADRRTNTKIEYID